MDGFVRKNGSELLEIAQKIFDNGDIKEDSLVKINNDTVAALHAPGTSSPEYATYKKRKCPYKGSAGNRDAGRTDDPSGDGLASSATDKHFSVRTSPDSGRTGGGTQPFQFRPPETYDNFLNWGPTCKLLVAPGASLSVLLRPLRPLDKRTMEEQRTAWEIENHNWTTKWTVVFIFTQWNQQISAIKGPTGIPGAQLNAVVFCTENMVWIIRKSSQMQNNAAFSRMGLRKPLAITTPYTAQAGTVTKLGLCAHRISEQSTFISHKRGLQSSCFP